MSDSKRTLAYSEPAPHDAFDPRLADAIPFTLEQLERAVGHALKHVEMLVDAIEGCMTPLDLSDEHRVMSNALETLSEMTADLTLARQKLDADAPLAKIPRGETSAWTERSENPVLTPAEIVVLAQEATRDDLTPSITYEQAIADFALVPSVAVDRITSEAIKARRQDAAAETREAKKERYVLHQGLLADMESRACDTCGAPAGAYCRTNAGRISNPHAFRLNASPLARENKMEATLANRPDTEREWTPGPDYVKTVKKLQVPEVTPDPEESVRNRTAARSAITSLAQNWSNLNR